MVQNGLVVVHVPNQRYGRAHEQATRTEVARRLAGLKGFGFAGAFEPSKNYPGPVYFVPSDTLVEQEAGALGVENEHDLFGGVVPYGFVATKAITHPLVDPGAAAPLGWSSGLVKRLEGSVLSGFSAFSLDDARRAGVRLLKRGAARLKPVRETGGLGQVVVGDVAALERTLAALDPAEVARDGVVLEENLSEVTTYSVGQVRVADSWQHITARSASRPTTAVQRCTAGPISWSRGAASTCCWRSICPRRPDVRSAQARAYDTAARSAFPACSRPAATTMSLRAWMRGGELRSGVLEQSWRIGGASGAEIAALEAFRADPALQAVRASTVEIYGDSDPATARDRLLPWHRRRGRSDDQVRRGGAR